MGWTPAALAARLPDPVVEVWVSTRGEFYGKDDGAYSKRKMRFSRFARELGRVDPRRRLYLVAQPLRGDFSALRADLRLSPSLRLKKPEVRLWAGQSGNHTRLHYDVLHNLFVQIAGRKRFRVVAPRFTKRLQPAPANSGQAAVLGLADVPDGVPSREVRVGPGDVFFLPAFWCHEVYTEEGGISVNFWWRPPLEHLGGESLARLLASPYISESPARLKQFVELPAAR